MYFNNILKLLSFLKLVEGLDIQNYFKISKSKDLIKMANNTNYLISSTNKLAKLFCLSACSSDLACLSAVFCNEKKYLNNCNLYNRYFYSNELINSISSTFYEKINKSQLFSIQITLK